jgi:hypothetical protein
MCRTVDSGGEKRDGRFYERDIRSGSLKDDRSLAENTGEVEKCMDYCHP